jgi:hypothetical protein
MAVVELEMPWLLSGCRNSSNLTYENLHSKNKTADEADDSSILIEARAPAGGYWREGDMEQKDMICRPERQTCLILREDKLGEREFRVDKLKHLTADLVHRDIEHLADSL